MTKIKKIWNRIRAFFPSPLPVGIAEFDEWSASILELSVVPANDSTLFALATMVLHLDSTSNYKSKEYFIRTLHKSAANQIAAGVMQDLKEKQVAKARAEQEAAARNIPTAIETTSTPIEPVCGAV